MVKRISLLIVLLFYRGLCSGEETREKKINQEVKLETQELTKKIAANREGLGLCTAIKKKISQKKSSPELFHACCD